MHVDRAAQIIDHAGVPTLHPAYQRLVRNEPPRSVARELGIGIVLLLAILLGFLLLPALPGEQQVPDTAHVGSAPPRAGSGRSAVAACSERDPECAIAARQH